MNARPSTARASSAASGAWLAHHAGALRESLRRCGRRPWATILTILVMGLALVLPMGLSIILDNVKHLAGSVQESRTINLFLHPDFTVEQARQLGRELEQRPDVAAIELRTPEQGLAELRDNAGMGAAIDALEDNPLPSLLLVTPGVQADPAALVAALEALPQADLVQHDAAWRQRLEGWLSLGGRLANLLTLLFGAAAVLVVGNTIRLELLDRAEEVRVLQQLGADDAFIRRPFLYLGAGYGLGAGAVALGLWATCMAVLRGPMAALADSYGSAFAFKTLDLLHSSLVLLGAMLLGMLGAWLVVSHSLRGNRSLEHRDA